MSASSLQDRKSTLIKQREQLRQRLDAIREDFAKGLDQDWEEQAVQLENAEVLNEIARVTAEELSKIEVAVERIERELISNRK